jgi:hypothetical protein
LKSFWRISQALQCSRSTQLAAALLITACGPAHRTRADDGILAAETALSPAGQGEYTFDITVRNAGTTENIKLYYDCDMLVWLSDFIINDACASQRPLTWPLPPRLRSTTAWSPSSLAGRHSGSSSWGWALSAADRLHGGLRIAMSCGEVYCRYRIVRI